MTEFIADGTKWVVELDGLLLAELRDTAKVDIVQDGLYDIEEREDVLAKALVVICRDQIIERKLTDRKFAALLSGTVADEAIAAVRGAAQLFFRPSRWSEMESRCNQRKDIDAQYQSFRPMMELLNRQDLPTAMREAVMSAIAEKIKAATSSPTSEAAASASGQDVSRPSAVGSLPGSLESPQRA